MEKKNLFRRVWCVMFMAVTLALVACSDDNTGTDPISPRLSLPEEAEEMNFSADEGSRTFTLTANCQWKAYAGEKWITVTPMSGNGTTEITVTVAATDIDRETYIGFNIVGEELHVPGFDASIHIVQSGKAVEEPQGTITIPEIIARMTDQQAVLDEQNDQTLIAVVTTDRKGGNFTSKNLQVMTEGATEKGHGLTLYGSNAVIDPSNEAFDLEAGDKIKITFKAGLARIVNYSGLYEVTGSAGEEWVEIEKLGHVETAPIAAAADCLADYQSMLVALDNAVSPARAVEWGSETSTKTHTFTVGATPVTLFIQYASPTFIGKYIAPEATGTLTGVVTVYKGNAQLMPRSIDDVAAFVGDKPAETTSFYYNDFDKEIVQKIDGSWPYCDEWEGWKNEQGTGIAALEYEVKGVSPRSNEPSNSQYSDYPGSGGNLILFSSGVTYMSINKIDVGAERNLRLTFGAMRYDMQAEDNRFRKEDFNVQIRLDGGSTWSAPLDYTLKTEGTDHYWSQAVCDFTLARQADNVSVRFTSLTSSTNRIDDVELAAGQGGQSVDGTGATDPARVSTIAEVTAAANGQYTIQGKVSATYTRGFVVSDATGSIVVYQGNNPEYVARIGDEIRAAGVVTEPYYVKQMSYADITLLSAGEYAYGEPAAYDATAIAAFMAAPKTEYVTITGTMTDLSTISVEGTDVVVEMPYLSDGQIDQTMVGKQVEIDAYTIGTDRNRTKISVMLVGIDMAGGSIVVSAMPQLLSFAPQGGSKTVELTLYNGEGCTIRPTIDNDRFTAEVADGNIIVTARENSDAQNIETAMTVDIIKESAVAATTRIRLTQGAAAQDGLITVRMTAQDIIDNRNGATELEKGKYGNQNVSNIDSWYTWTQYGYDMAGARIGISQKGIIPNTLQMQGNDTKVTNQGIIANMNSLGRIVKVVIRTKNENQYTPNHTLYAGTEACPSQTVVEAETVTETDTVTPDRVSIYTQTYDLTGGNYTYFKMHNDKAGVAYVDSIEITYEK